MNSKASEIFGRSVTVPKEVLESFLSAECGDDRELRQEVERLLEDASKADTFFCIGEDDTVVLEGSRDERVFEKEGDEIGPYKLLEKIGEGGFGVVWRAEQKRPISRQVALKIVKAGMDTKQVLARFEAERQALAMMDHENIARVYEAGATTAGRPYFAMELVAGVPITKFCSANNLNHRARLDLFCAVCSAVNHAHQKGIIHRDIKPSNVLVSQSGERPVVKVIDFGIAKAIEERLTESTLFTAAEQILGTPVYMSPEQTATSGVDIDTRTDIYSLGVLLYEMLTGSPPFDPKSLLASGREEMARVIREEDPPKPSTRLISTQETLGATEFNVRPGILKGDLDWIIMKAIEKERSRRYDTAVALSEDIGRYLEKKPVHAAAPSTFYRFSKFSRRHRLAITLSCLIVGILLVATSVSIWLALRAFEAEKDASNSLTESEISRRQAESERLKAESARIDAENARVEAEQSREEAEKSRDVAEKAREEADRSREEAEKSREAAIEAQIDAEIISGFLSKIFRSPIPDRDGRKVTVAETLDRAVLALEEEEGMLPRHRTNLQDTLAKTYHSLGFYEKSKNLYLEVTTYYAELNDEGNPNYQNARQNLAVALSSLGEFKEALKIEQDLYQRRKQTLGEDDPATLRSMQNLAATLGNLGKINEALELRKAAVPVLEKVYGAKHEKTGQGLSNLSVSYFECGHYDQAIEALKKALAFYMESKGPEHPVTLALIENLGTYCEKMKLHKDALEVRIMALKIHREINGDDHPGTITAMHNLANSLDQNGRHKQAMQIRQGVYQLRRKILGAGHIDTIGSRNNLASSYFTTKKFAEALDLREKVLNDCLQHLGPSHPLTFFAKKNLAKSFEQSNQMTQALKLREEVLLGRVKLHGDDHVDTLEAKLVLASSYSHLERFEESHQLLEEVIDWYSEFAEPDDPSALSALKQIAEVFQKEGNTERAEELLKQISEVKGSGKKEETGAD